MSCRQVTRSWPARAGTCRPRQSDSNTQKPRPRVTVINRRTPKVRVEQFDGKARGLEQFLKSIEFCAGPENDEDHDEEKLLLIRQNLQGTAKAFINSLPRDQRDTYDKIVEALREQYPTRTESEENQSERWLERMMRLTQNRDEKIADYLSEARSILKRVGPGSGQHGCKKD